MVVNKNTSKVQDVDSNKKLTRCELITLILGMVLTLSLSGVAIAVLLHDCSDYIVYNDGIAVEEDGSTVSSGICSVCNKLIVFENSVEQD